MNQTFKPIPNNDKWVDDPISVYDVLSFSRVDLARFRVKDPLEWSVDDVVPWIMDVAKRHRIPYEDMNMHEVQLFLICWIINIFFSLPGWPENSYSRWRSNNSWKKIPLMVLWYFGILRRYCRVYKCKQRISTYNIIEDILDDFIRKYPTEDEPMMTAPSTSFELPKPTPQLSQSQQQLSNPLGSPFSMKDTMSQQTLNQNLIQGSQNLIHTLNSLNSAAGLDLNTVSLTQTLASTIAAGLNTGKGLPGLCRLILYSFQD